MQVCCCVAVLCVYLFLLLRDDDMISLASMMSVSNLSMIGNLEEDEEFNIWWANEIACAVLLPFPNLLSEHF